MSVYKPKVPLCAGDKILRVGRAEIVVPDRAQPRWLSRPERLLVLLDGEVSVYDAEGRKVEISDQQHAALLARWTYTGPFADHHTHPSVIAAN